MMRNDLLQIHYTLEFSSPFHCGTGVKSGLIDRSVMRDSEGYLYVPGTTIKGTVRELCEQIARFYEDSDQIMRARIASPHDKKIALKDLGAQPTLITRIFGSQIHPGQLYFNDARLLQSDKDRYGTRERGESKRYLDMQTDHYTQVQLNRLRRTATQGALYSSEFGVRAMIFQGSITGNLECLPITNASDETFSGKENEPTYSLLLLLSGLYMLERLGGNKSAGKGECRCNIVQLKINKTSFTTKDTDIAAAKQWESWLQHLHVLSYYSFMLQEEE